MKHRPYDMNSHHNTERGVALPAAIFIISVLAILSAFMVSLTGTQQTITSQAVTAARVSLAARSGLEWAVHKAVAPSTQPGTCDASTTFSPAGIGLTGTSVAVTCSYSSLGAGSKTYHVYYLTSTASYGIATTPDYVERSFEATVCRSSAVTAAEC